MKICVFTYGCKVNFAESDSLIEALKRAGHEVTDELQPADLYIVNTCAVTAEAQRKSRQAVSRISKLNQNAKIIFTGCASQNEPESFLLKKNNSLVTGTFGKSEIPSLLEKEGLLVKKPDEKFDDQPFSKTDRVRSFIKVQDGCDNFCTYCIIPYLRGRSRSRSIESIVKEVKESNALEIVVNGINLSDYNDNGRDLADLITALSFTDKRIRLGSLETALISDKLINALKNLKNFAPHFHLSLQSGSNSVLKAMNRHYNIDEFYKTAEKLKGSFPFAAITTDVIVGFPTETEENFIETVDFVKKVGFADIHAFPYSPRKGTIAYTMKDLSKEVKKDRLKRLLTVKEELRNKFFNENVGGKRDVIVEEVSGGFSVGHTDNYIKTYVKGEKAGVINVKLTAPFKDGMIGE